MLNAATNIKRTSKYLISRELKKSFFSKREKEVLHLIAHELTTREIAATLYFSEHTIDSHKKNLKTKMAAKNTAGLVRRGFELGLLSLTT